MHIPKAFYFFFYAALAAISPFLVLFFEHLGFSGTRIGVLVGIPRLVALVGGPAWSVLADATHQHRRLLAGSICGTLAVVLGMAIAHDFWVFVVLMGLFALCMAPVTPLVDNAVLDLLGDRRDAYGRQRLWGTIGWGVSTAALGYVTERFGLSWIFGAYLSLMSVALFLALRLPISKPTMGTAFWYGVRALVGNRMLLMLAVTVFLLGMCSAMVRSYLLLHLGALGASRSLIGWAMTLGVVGELPVFFFGGGMLRRWGPRGLMLVAIGIFTVQAGLFSVIGSPWLILPVQMLHGPSFSALLTSRVAYAKKLAPPGLGTTAQSLLGAIAGGLSGAAGVAVGGVVYDTVGGVGLFQLAALGSGVALVFFATTAPRTDADTAA